MSVLTLMTWNVTGIMSSLCYLNDALEKKRIYAVYQNIAACDSSLNVYNKCKVGKGGVALMWRKHL